VKKTNRVVVAHEDKIVGGVGGEIVAEINANCFKYLDAPIERVGSKFVPVGFAKSYEKATLPNQDDIFQAVLKVMNY
jgi:2-oxoisovalerate dehydrogenase E1 component